MLRDGRQRCENVSFFSFFSHDITEQNYLLHQPPERVNLSYVNRAIDNKRRTQQQRFVLSI